MHPVIRTRNLCRYLTGRVHWESPQRASVGIAIEPDALDGLACLLRSEGSLHSLVDTFVSGPGCFEAILVTEEGPHFVFLAGWTGHGARLVAALGSAH